MKKFIPVFVIVFVVGAAGGFFVGSKFGQKNIRGAVGGERVRGAGMAQRFGGSAGAGFVSGEVISKDATSMTVKLRDGGSKIIFVSGATEVVAVTRGSLADVKVGSVVTVMGDTGSDGSVTAKSVQVRASGVAGGAGVPQK